MMDYVKSIKAPCPLHAGDWIAYDDQVFHDRTIVTRITEIDNTSEFPLRLATDHLLDRTHSIRRFCTEECPQSIDPDFMRTLYRSSSVSDEKAQRIKNSGEKRCISEFDLVDGKIVYESLESQMRREVREDKDKMREEIGYELPGKKRRAI